MNTCPKKPYDECKLRDLYMDIVGHPLYCISLLPVFQPHLAVYFPTGSNVLIYFFFTHFCAPWDNSFVHVHR